MKTLRLFLIAPTMLAVAACNSTSTPPPELPDFPVSGQFLNAGETPMPSTVTLVAIHPDTYETTPVPVSAQSVVYGDLLAIDTSIVGDDGSFEWDLGDGSDIPAGYMAPASQAFVTPAITDDVTCTSTASAAVSVLRSLVFPGAFVSPIGIVGPLSDDANFALGVAIGEGAEEGGAGEFPTYSPGVAAEGQHSGGVAATVLRVLFRGRGQLVVARADDGCVLRVQMDAAQPVPVGARVLVRARPGAGRPVRETASALEWAPVPIGTRGALDGQRPSREVEFENDGSPPAENGSNRYPPLPIARRA